MQVVPAALTLAECGISLLKAKRALEQAMETGLAYLILPAVSQADALVERLAALGLSAKITTPPPEVSVREVRESLGLTQEQFAACFGLELRTIQSYEAGRRKPDRNVRALINLIRRDPERARKLAVS